MGEWEELRDRVLDTPELRAQYERTRKGLARTREMLLWLDAQRASAGLSKAELARRAGLPAESVRRLFTSQNSNPGLRTFLAIVDALGGSVNTVPSERRRTASAQRSPGRVIIRGPMPAAKAGRPGDFGGRGTRALKQATGTGRYRRVDRCPPR